MKQIYLRLQIWPIFVISTLVLAIPPAVFAEQGRLFSSKISDSTIRSLGNAAAGFNRGGLKASVGFSLPIPQKVLDIQLEPHDIRAPGYRSLANGKVEAPFEIDLFRGVAGSEDAESFTRFSLIHSANGETELRGYLLEDGVFYKVEQDDANNEIFHISTLTEEEAELLVAECGTTHAQGSSPSQGSHSARGGMVQGYLEESPIVSAALIKEIQIATEADFEYVIAEGSVAAANANILSILNAVDAIYRAELGATLSVTFQNAWNTASDPYTTTNSSALLDEFRNYWETNFSATRNYDLGHFWTAKDLDGSIIGIAFVAALCGTARYGLSQRLNSTSSDVPLAAHEIGHTSGSSHDDPCSNSRWVMCAFLQANADLFSTSSKSQVASHLGSVSCLADVDDGGGGGNNAPILDPIGPKTVEEAQTLTINLSASDADSDPLSYSATPVLTGDSLVGATYTYVPPQGTVPGGEASTTSTVTFSVSDGNGGIDAEAVVITITKNNRAPDLAALGSTSVAEGTLYSLQLIGIDPDNDPVTYHAISVLPAGAVLDSSTGIFLWNPAGDQSGVYNIQFSARDNFGAEDIETLTLTVTDTPSVPPLPGSYTHGDFDGDGKSEFAVVRSTTFDWFSGSEDSLPSGSYVQDQVGLSEDIPVVGDFNGDRISDRGVFRRSDRTWYIKMSGTNIVSSFGYGFDADIPAPADYDGDGRTDYGVFRASLGLIIYRPSSSSGTTDIVISGGQRGDLPASCDYDGDGADEPTFYRPSNGTFTIVDGGQTIVTLGDAAAIPVPGDYNGDGTCEPTVWHPETGDWENAGGTTQFGLGGDVPIARMDFDGDGDDDFVVFRPGEANWYARENSGAASLFQLGLPSDITALQEALYYAMRESKGGFALAQIQDPGVLHVFRASAQTLFSIGLSSFTQKSISAPAGSYILKGDYDGDSNVDIAVYYLGFWTVSYGNGTSAQFLWGVATDIPVAGDFDGDGQSDIAVYRPDDGGGFSAWYIINSSTGLAKIFNFGLNGDVPIPADYNGDGWTDIAVVRESLGTWFVMDARSGFTIQIVQWGLAGDTFRVADFDDDGRADKVAWRQGIWYVLQSSGIAQAVAWGLPGDFPIAGRFVGSDVNYGVLRPANGLLYLLSSDGSSTAISTGTVSSDQPTAVLPSTPIQ